MLNEFDTVAAWQPDKLMEDKSWVFHLTKSHQKHLTNVIKRSFHPQRALFDYSPDEFDLGPVLDLILAASRHAYFGPGLSLVKGLPRDKLSEKEFRLLVWSIGLYLGVARPQGIASQYMSEVRSTGMDYRSPSGRGYNSNVTLDFHCDGCDLVALACYNKAKSGGKSIISSSVTAWNTLLFERPDLAEVACSKFFFSRNQEQAPDELPYYGQPLFDFENGNLFAKWNRNRIRTGQALDGVPKLSLEQRECTDILDEILLRPNVMFSMWLEPGDLQFINNHVMLHSRTAFDDFKELNRKRLLYRLWIAPPFSIKLPMSWKEYFRSISPGTVRGGIRGHKYDSYCEAFDTQQAKNMGMSSEK